PAPLQGATRSRRASGGYASLHHRLVSTAPPALEEFAGSIIFSMTPSITEASRARPGAVDNPRKAADSLPPPRQVIAHRQRNQYPQPEQPCRRHDPRQTAAVAQVHED